MASASSSRMPLLVNEEGSCWGLPPGLIRPEMATGAVREVSVSNRLDEATLDLRTTDGVVGDWVGFPRRLPDGNGGEALPLVVGAGAEILSNKAFMYEGMGIR